IAKFEGAGFQVGFLCYGISIDLCFILIDPYDFPSKKRQNGLSHDRSLSEFCSPSIDIRLTKQIDDFVFEGSEISSNTVTPVVRDLIRPVERHFKPGIANNTHISQHASTDQRYFDPDSCIFGIPGIIIRIQRQSAVKKIGRQSKIEFFDYFPPKRRENVGRLCAGYHLTIKYRIDYLGGPGTVGCLDVVITEFTPACPEFEVIDARYIEKIFLRQNPSRSYGRKVPPFFLVFGAAICPEGPVQQVFMIKVVGQSSEV